MLLALMEWGDKYIQNGQPAIDVVDVRNGQNIKIGIIDESQDTINLSNIGVKWR